MCGRFSTPEQEIVMRHFFIEKITDYARRYNVAPTQPIPAIKKKGELSYLHWGLIPSWAKEKSIGNKMINARSETILEKPSFKRAVKSRRCLIVAAGFYEWKKVGSRKQPYYIFMKEHEPFAMGGIWERWVSPEGEVIESAAIITTSSNKLIQPLHDRMPLILKKEDYEAWLAPETSEEELKKLFVPYAEESMNLYPVSTLVNKASNEHSDCIMETPLSGLG